jgi:cytidylate kinase
MIISIDGLAGVGKSTIARQIAKKIGAGFLSSGNLYRAITLYVLNKNLLFNPSLENLLKNIYIEIYNNKIKINEIIFSEDMLRTKDIDNAVVLVAQIQTVRNIINAKLRSYAENKWIIIDGRDIGSCVFPEAEIKFYFVSDIKNSKKEEALLSLIERDTIDMKRDISPLKNPKGSIEINTFSMSLDVLINHLVSIIKKRLITCESPWLIDSIIDLNNNKDIFITSKPTFDNLAQISNYKFVIFTERLNFLSHETMLFADYQIPFIHDVNLKMIDSNKIKINTLSNRGYILQYEDAVDYKFNANKNVKKTDNALVSSISGMEFFKNHNVKHVATRAEFIFLQKLKNTSIICN